MNRIPSTCLSRSPSRLVLVATLFSCGAVCYIGGLGHGPLRDASLKALMAANPEILARVPVERLNAECLEGICSTGVTACQALAVSIEKMAERVRSETDRHAYRFTQNPAEFEHSQAFFRMLMMAVVLSEDFGIHYATERQSGTAQSSSSEDFFSDPDLVFITGLLGPRHAGTCSSMPILQLAIGRNLGYPLKLVTTRGHLFLRWEDKTERINIECTSKGLNTFSDDYYRHWPFELEPGEEQAEGYLKSLTPSEEFAVFLSIRGICLKAAGRMPEAVEAFAAAARFAPSCASYHRMANVLAKTSPGQTGTTSHQGL